MKFYLQNFFKSKLNIAMVVNVGVIIVSMFLTYVHNVFIPITSILSGIFCFLLAVAFKIKNNKLKQINANVETEQTSPTYTVEKIQTKTNAFYEWLKVVLLIIFGIVFVALGINMF